MKLTGMRTGWLYCAGLFWIILAAKLCLSGQFGNSTPLWAYPLNAGANPVIISFSR